MTSRQRNNSTSSSVNARRNRRSNRRKSRRQNLVETLESRQLLAGPQLIGIQPNEGALIEDGTVRDRAPRVLTFGFDANQQIDTSTLEGIRLTRSGNDGVFETADDVVITPGLVTLGDTNQNEVVVRFAESLPDDDYRIEVFGFDDPALNVTGLRNTNGELFMPSDPERRSEVINFELRLGALIEAVVPQPVVRLADGSLTQNRNEIVIYFNEDELFVENDASGAPTARSAENPRFYQLLFTQETVRTTDDVLFQPDQVAYDPSTHTARLFFSDDINDLPGIPPGGGTWRLRVGTAVDTDVDLILEPNDDVPVAKSVVTDFQHPGLRVKFFSTTPGEGGMDLAVRFEDTLSGGISARVDTDTVVFDFGGTTPVVSQLKLALMALGSAPIDVEWEQDGVAGQGSTLPLPRSIVGAPPLNLTAVGDTLQTAFDVGIFGQFNDLKSLVFSESIDPQPFAIELPGGQDDPGHTDEIEHINQDFGADTLAGITEIAYNFNDIFDTAGPTSFLNQITPRQKTRIREALNLWAAEIGVQFRETQSEGITFALGDPGDLQTAGGIAPVNQAALNASMRIDPTFANSAMVFSNQVAFGTAYGEDFTRKAAAGIGLLLGLNQTPDLPPPTLMSLNGGFLNASINSLGDLEPVFPSNFDVLHGQYVHRPDSIDIDMYRFEVDLKDADKVGTLTAETFAERLSDASLLDTTLTLFEEVSATAMTDFGYGVDLAVEITSLMPGRLGNNSRLDFIQTDRAAGDTSVNILRSIDAAGNLITNGILVDLPRNAPSLPAGDVVDAINNDPFASSIFRAAIVTGDRSIDIIDAGVIFSPVLLDGGGLFQINRNDDYFGEDSRIITSLGEGVYYLGVAASGNNHYDPTIAGSGYGGRTQGDYELHLKFEPQVDEVDVIRDLDSDRLGVPGAALDGDGDGIPGGVHNFWFQTRPLNRTLNFTDNGAAITAGQTIKIVGASGVTRTFEFVPNGAAPRPGNVPVPYIDGTMVGAPTPAGNLALALRTAINSRRNETGVSAGLVGASVVLTGERSVEFSNDFRGADALGRNIFVDKAAGPQADGSLTNPFNNIASSVVANAFGSTLPGDIVRIVGNGGSDNDMTTETDNFSYQIGVTETGGRSLVDGRNMEVPRGVTTMIDAGAVFKLRNAFIGIGSSTVQVDRSGGALQVLGTPRLVQLSEQGDPVTTTLIGGENVDAPGYDDGSVIFTSTRDRAADAVAAGSSLPASAGNWGGLVYRRDIDQNEGRRDLEDEGIFLQRVNHAEVRYGGSSTVLIDSVQQLVNPIQIVNMRPTVTFNEITQSADSAISAAPNSFEETSYQSPRFQQAGKFTADYDRVGPEIHNNQLFQNSINGLFIRATTTPTETPKQFTVAARFDDIDVVHYVSENLVVASAPGGSIEDGFAPSMSLVSAQELAGGTLAAATYEYKMTFVDRDGFESLASADTFSFTVNAADSSVQLASLPGVEEDGDYVSRRLYRATAGAMPEFRLVADLDSSTTGFIDDGTTGDAILDLTRQGVRGRLDASLVMDPGLVTKLRGARIELGQGTQLLAEGLGSNPIVFSSSLDDRFGAGGTFDTNNDGDAFGPSRGDWAGIYGGPTSNISFDNVQLSYAGGISLLEGGLARGFLPLELQQAEGRITNSRFEFNDVGQDGQGPAGRFGRLAVTPATIMIRGSQPIIVGNTFVDNLGTIIDIDIESMGGNYRMDIGRQTGDVDRIAVLDDNHGPMIRFNRYLDNQLTGLEVRAGTITTETVFDDTDIAHLLFQNIEVGNFHSNGGLRLLSRPDESLVVKFRGPGTPNSDTAGTGITATGSISGIDDRIGGMVHIIGMPGSPVILTSLTDDTAGAGLKPDGSQFTDHNGDGFNSRPFPNDWRGVLLDQFSNDYNIPVLPELELSTEVAPGLNATVENAQYLGELASDLLTGDHDRRLGFEVQGYLSGTTDVDVYSFLGKPGTEVWVDIDKTSFTLDTVIELLNENGEVLARTDNSFAETLLGPNRAEITVLDPDLQGVTSSLQAENEFYTDRGVGGLYEDFGSTNPRDAGIHFRLAGNTSDSQARSVYFFRVRSASLNPDDAQGGITGGAYRFQARLVEDQEFPGSVVRFADIRYANQGIHVRGLMALSPLLGEAQENEAEWGGAASNDLVIGATPGQGAQYLGNLVNNRDNVISVGGSLSSTFDVDLYQVDVNFSNVNRAQSTIFDIDYADGFNRPDTNISVFYEQDGVPRFEDQLSTANYAPQLVFFGSSSNIVDDLTSPNGENSALEKLVRGSISNGDPLIGPVALPEGTYYVAVSADGRVPFGLTTSVLEPINSIDRIVEDRIDRVNPETPSTAKGPVVPQLFTDASIAASAFSVDVDTRGGHGKPTHFDGSNGPLILTGAPRIPEVVVTGGGDAEDTPSATTSDLDSLNWSIADDPEIGATFGAIPYNTSTTIPHVSITGNLAGADTSDYYRFTLATGQRVIVDIDNGYDIEGEVDDDNDPLTPPVQLDPFSFDGILEVLTPDPVNPGAFLTVATNDDVMDERDGQSGSNSPLDPFLDLNLPAGVYFIGVRGGTTAATAEENYTLHVSVEDHVLPPGTGTISLGTEVLSFDRATVAPPPSASITSEAFDLAGYVPADLPKLYFNRLYDPALGDAASMTITSLENPVGQQVHTFTAGSWSQVRVPLDAFAGDTGIRIRIDYTTNGSLSAAEGLRLDDFIVGFAERGETVFGAPSGAQFVGGGFGGVSGEYQLETRLATDFTTSIPTGLTLDTSFDTNDRQSQSVTLVAPDGSQIAPGDTFVLGDGVARQVFEFRTTGSVTFGNTPVTYSPSDSPAQVAAAIRTAITNQTVIELEASTASGQDTQAPTDGRLTLSGRANGTFDPIVSAALAPATLLTDADGHLLMPAILHDGQGDENFLRPQGQVIVEHNTISDVRAIGIWSEPGLRDVNPNHRRNNSLLVQPPVANSYPGAVRNLPTLNDSVIGGLTPGIVIQNNTIDKAMYAGIKVDGQIAPLTIEVPNGDEIRDGSTFTITAGNTTVTFEFEDIGDGDPGDNPGGSDVEGGNGWGANNVPVYYRHNDDAIPPCYLSRCFEYTPLETLHAIRESIQGSILMTNGLVELVEPYVGPSLTSQGPRANSFPEEFFPTPALYVDGASFITGAVASSPAVVYEPPQPFARVVNNTIYGDDGSDSAFRPAISEPDDFLVSATETKVGASHREPYRLAAVLGDNDGPLAEAADVDFYRVFLDVGDRLIADIDTLDEDLVLGIVEGPNTMLRIFDAQGREMASNDLGTAPNHLEPLSRPYANATDPVNPRDAFVDFTAPETGTYYVAVSSEGNDQYDPQALSGRVEGTGGIGDYVISLQTYAPRTFALSLPIANVDGATNALLGDTFTITTMQDTAADGTNQYEFIFGPATGPGQISIPINANDRVPDVMRAIEGAINGSNAITVLPNVAPIPDREATALGGRSGNAANLSSFGLYGPDFNTGGFGHNRSASPGSGSTELYVFVEKVAELSISSGPLSVSGGPGSDADQLIDETGLLIGGGASPAVLNNVFLNLNNALNVAASSKPMEVVVVGSAFQNNLSTSNVNGGSDDFNITLGGNEPLLQQPGGNNFQPAANSLIIDSSVNSLNERDPFRNLKDSVGLPISNVLAPTRDVSGILRADNPDFAPPGGIGSSVFKDRGSSELADFVGPVAIAEVPRDNDAEGIDEDPATSFINLSKGIYEEFRIQLRDNGDASDPFAGIGIDDATVVVPEIPGLRPTGANVTLFENDRLLEQEIDYTFSFDETKNIITLTPLAGIWKNDRAYRIALNNRDRTALIAPDVSLLADGDQLKITDSTGGTIFFEFETGYQLLVPEPITLIVPTIGTAAGGLGDGDIFQINDGQNPAVVFEFNSGTATLPNTVEVPLPSDPTPTDEAELAAYLAGIAQDIQTAIDGEVSAGRLNLTTRVIDNQVVLGAEPGATARTSRSGLLQAVRTLGLNVPATGAGIGGVAVGDTFELSDGNQLVRFQFNDGTITTTPPVVPVDITPIMGVPLTQAEVADAIATAVAGSALGLNPQVVGSTVYLNLPTTGSATVQGGQLSVVGVARTPADEDTIVLTPDDGSAAVVLEINRTDEPDANGLPMNDGVTAPNIAVNINRATTADELAALIANAIRGESISGLDPNDVQVIPGGLVTVGGEQGLGLALTGTSVEIVGSPDVAGASTVQVFGPLLLNMPIVGGGGVRDGDTVIIQDNLGNDVFFEFDQNTTLNLATAVQVVYNSFDDVDTLSNNFVAVINTAAIGVTAQYLGNGQISLGRIDDARVNTNGDPLNGIPGAPQISTQRGIVADGEVLTISQGTISVSYEFESVVNGGGLTNGGDVQVAFQPGSTIGDVAVSLAAAINNNLGGLRLNAIAELDAAGVPTGQVILNDLPGTVVDVSRAPTLNVIGVPGGSIPVRISPAFSAAQVKQALLVALNSVNQPGELPVTTLAAQDRGGATLFVENGTIFEGPVENFYLPGVKDSSGNLLEANRDDFTTQFTILMPTVGLDFGDAPDPVGPVAGRYPTRLVQDGPRHVVDRDLTLGSLIDANLDGIPVPQADGDDFTIIVEATGPLFAATAVDGVAQITALTGTVDPTTRDGDLVTIDLGVAVATLELDLDGRFDEDNFAIRPADPTSDASIAAAIVDAINESPLNPAGLSVSGGVVSVIADDEDGVNFISEVNPYGVLNKGVMTPIDVTVTGSGFLNAWIDFNVDGDWDDPGEHIISADTPGAIFSDIGAPVTRTFQITVPEVTPDPPAPLDTYARFRVSREANLAPTGLALSGEVEDYVIKMLPGDPPTIGPQAANRTYFVDERNVLQVLDADGTLTPSNQNDNGLLETVSDPQGDQVQIIPQDVGIRTLQTAGGITAGTLEVFPDGIFTFAPDGDFNGVATFEVRVTDLHPLDPGSQLVSSTPISVTISVQPVNNPPSAPAPVEISREILEDAVQIFDKTELIDPFYIPGPADELDQPLIFESAFSGQGATLTPFMSSLGGSLAIINNGMAIEYTPPADYNGSTPDTFIYRVGDVPPVGQSPETATTLGTVTITFIAQNDPPNAEDDSYETAEDTPLVIPISGTVGGLDGILENDTPGPADEILAGQTVSLQNPSSQFPLPDGKPTFRGGSVKFLNGALTYTPPPLFSGVDQFDYTVIDSEFATATGTVTVVVGGVNNAPVFIGINGVLGADELEFSESKLIPQQFQYDLSTWFQDPESDAMTYAVSSDDPAIVAARIVGDTLVLDLPSFAFTEPDAPVKLTLTATDSNNDSSLPAVVEVTVLNTPDAPSVIGTLDPATTLEDQAYVANLADVFFDPDGTQLDYSIGRLDTIDNPTEAQIAQHPLVRSISFVGDTLRVDLEDDQSGSVLIDIVATDGLFRVSSEFTLTVAPVPDAPVMVDDEYDVPLGATLQVLNPASGLLGNDSDADGDPIVIDLASVSSPSRGTLSLSADGTFTYTNASGAVGQTDSFTYRLVGADPLDPAAVVTLNLNQSRYQNPIPGLEADVTADGNVTALDALRIMNLLNRQLQGRPFIPVNEIGAPPPDYYDVNGDGRVSSFDALLVVNVLNERALGLGEQIAPEAEFASTTNYATPMSAGLPTTNVTAVATDETAPIVTETVARDALFSAGVSVTRPDVQLDSLAEISDQEVRQGDVDEALQGLLDDLTSPSGSGLSWNP